MKYYKLNKDKSLELYNKKNLLLERKQCYTNTFMVVAEYRKNFKLGLWKVAYGYMKIAKDMNLYCRHSFILDENNKVIDVTLALLCDNKLSDTSQNIDEEICMEDKYIVMKIFDDVEEYLNALEQNGRYVDLGTYLHKEDVKLQEWAMENNILLCG